MASGLVYSGIGFIVVVVGNFFIMYSANSHNLGIYKSVEQDEDSAGRYQEAFPISQHPTHMHTT